MPDATLDIETGECCGWEGSVYRPLPHYRGFVVVTVGRNTATFRTWLERDGTRKFSFFGKGMC